MSFGGGLFTAAGMFVAAGFYDQSGGQTYLIGAFLSVASLGFLLALMRVLRRSGNAENGPIDLA